jgi:hypothetical protein
MLALPVMDLLILEIFSHAAVRGVEKLAVIRFATHWALWQKEHLFSIVYFIVLDIGKGHLTELVILKGGKNSKQI